jgi:poly-gamma-glutamate synthesis protein (capsule biosynthesis protein)
MSRVRAALSLFILLCLALGVAGLAVKTRSPGAATIIFGGDMNFDRYIREVIAERGAQYVFSCIRPLLASADVVVANLEGPITANPSVSLGSETGTGENLTFTFPTTTPALLLANNIRIVSIGNNHIMNFGLDGLNETKRFLSASGVSYFGDPDAVENDRVLRTTISGVPFSFVNWSDWTSDNTDITAAQVAKEKHAGRVVVVYAHWGEEYVPPPARVVTLAHDFVDEGADIVIGSHPHIVQAHETYKGVPIYYSLGNFVFDQYFEKDVREGLLLKVSFNADGASDVEELPIELETDGRTCLK